MNELQKSSLEYLNAIESRLKISQNNFGQSVFVPDRIKKKDIIKLNNDISDIYSKNLNDFLHQTYTDGEKIIQGIGFGLVNDFEKFIKVGMLYSNRVILWDYLWGRILSDVDNYKKNLDTIGIVSNNLIQIKESVVNGGIVILPHPSSWNSNTNTALSELRKNKKLFNTTNFGLVSALSVALDLNIHPYTLYDENTPTIDGSDKFSKVLNQDKTDYLYNLTKLLDEKPFELIDHVTANEFHKFLTENPDFFNEFRDTFLIPNSGRTDAEKNQIFNQKKESVLKAIEQRHRSTKNSSLANHAERVTYLSALASIVYGFTTASPEVPLAASIATLSASLTKHILELSKKRETNTLILGFEKLDEIKNTSHSKR